MKRQTKPRKIYPPALQAMSDCFLYLLPKRKLQHLGMHILPAKCECRRRYKTIMDPLWQSLSYIPHNPCLAGKSVCADAWAKGAEPIPASFEAVPLDKPYLNAKNSGLL